MSGNPSPSPAMQIVDEVYAVAQAVDVALTVMEDERDGAIETLAELTTYAREAVADRSTDVLKRYLDATDIERPARPGRYTQAASGDDAAEALAPLLGYAHSQDAPARQAEVAQTRPTPRKKLPPPPPPRRHGSGQDRPLKGDLGTSPPVEHASADVSPMMAASEPLVDAARRLGDAPWSSMRVVHLDDAKRVLKEAIAEERANCERATSAELMASAFERGRKDGALTATADLAAELARMTVAAARLSAVDAVAEHLAAHDAEISSAALRRAAEVHGSGDSRMALADLARQCVQAEMSVQLLLQRLNGETGVADG